jgi:hypothetical protein
MHKLKINVHGESWMLKKFKCSKEDLVLCTRVAEKMKLTITEALLDPFFYYHLQSNTVQSLEKLPGAKITSLLNTPQNQIEILLDGKRLKKLNIENLINQASLFPLYNIHTKNISQINETGIYIEQKAIGFVGSYEIEIDHFHIEDITFNLIKHCKELLFHYPSHKTKSFQFKKKSTLLTYQNCFEIK